MNTNDESFHEALGFRLKTLRQVNRMSQERLGELLGVSFQQIQKYESGRNRLSTERLHQCTKTFNVPVSYFFGPEGEEKRIDYDRKVITIAAAIASLPSDEICKHLYYLVLAINDNLKKDQSDKVA